MKKSMKKDVAVAEVERIRSEAHAYDERSTASLAAARGAARSIGRARDRAIATRQAVASVPVEHRLDQLVAAEKELDDAAVAANDSAVGSIAAATHNATLLRRRTALAALVAARRRWDDGRLTESTVMPLVQFTFRDLTRGRRVADDPAATERATFVDAPWKRAARAEADEWLAKRAREAVQRRAPPPDPEIEIAAEETRVLIAVMDLRLQHAARMRGTRAQLQQAAVATAARQQQQHHGARDAAVESTSAQAQ